VNSELRAGAGRELSVSSCQALTRCGVLSGSADDNLEPHLVDDLVVFTDPDVPYWQQAPHYVDPLWEGALLASLMAPAPGGRGLDVGCGSGVLSLALVAYCDEVLGIDVNPRALALAELNRRLNRIDHVRFERQDLFPATERFDRIVFNSPTDDEGREQRSLLQAGEDLLERFFRGLARHLTPTGLAEVNLAMNDYPDDAFADRLARWLGGDIEALILVAAEREEAKRRWRRGWLVARFGAGGVTERICPYIAVAERRGRQAAAKLVARAANMDRGRESRRATTDQLRRGRR
jgi:SAM-dependent methyltransferase